VGYHTEFRGAFAISPPLRAHHLAYLRKFNEIRHEKRDPEVAAKIPDPLREAVGLPLGPDACFFVGEPTPDDPTLLGNFETATSQPASYYCQWMPSDDGKLLVWDGGEKFYEYVEWLQYLIDNFFVSWGYVINGSVRSHLTHSFLGTPSGLPLALHLRPAPAVLLIRPT